MTISRYQVTDRLGHGGMGTVYLARDPSLERLVAIKLMRSGFDNPDLRERFVREARAVAALRHPCIVTLFEYGDHAGQPFIVMEYVNGKTLAAIIASRTPMTLTRRLHLIEDMCRGLEHAHKAGIIHRDVKPANIMVDSEGTLKILDFGIAKQGHAGLTRITGLVGTPRYMAPEQIIGKAVTRRSDIFAIGLVAYELLAFEPAYVGESDYAVMNAIVNDVPRPLTTHAPELDLRVVRIVEKALERDPDRRYQDLSQMRRDVERIRLEMMMAEPSHVPTIPLFPVPKVQQLEELAHRRAQQIAANLENAERAFDLGDYGAAQAACEDALIIDPQDKRALEGLQRAESALAERQAFAHLHSARQHLANNEITLAEVDVRQAFALAPALREGIELQEEVGSARQKKDQRGRSVKIALDRAKIRFGEGAFESAINAADEALAYEPGDGEALRLKAESIVALEEHRRRSANRRAQSAIEEATRLAARDRYDEALAVLDDRAVASHVVVQEARARIERDLREFERLKARARERAHTVVSTAPVAADTVRLPRPDTHIQIAIREAGSAAPVGARVLDIDDSPGFLPGPVRHRRPRPPRRPVQFLAADGTAGGRAGEFMRDQVFVLRKQGHDSVGYGVSLGVHAVALAAVVAAVLARPELVLPPPEPPLVMVTAMAPPPPPAVEMKPPPVTPTRPRTEPSRQTTVQPQVVAPAQPPLPAPVQAPVTLPTSESVLALPITKTETAQTIVVPPPPPLPSGGIDGIISEVPVTDYDRDPVIIRKVQPKVGAGASGTVRVEVTILANGRVSRATVIDRNSPWADVVREAALQCLFEPARRRGKPVTINTQIDFELSTKR